MQEIVAPAEAGPSTAPAPVRRRRWPGRRRSEAAEAAKPKSAIVKEKKANTWSEEEEGSLLYLYKIHGKKVAKVVLGMAELGYARSAQACRVKHRKLVGPETGVIGRHRGHHPSSKPWSPAETKLAAKLRAQYRDEKGRDAKGRDAWVAKMLNQEFWGGESVRNGDGSVRNHFQKIEKRKAARAAGTTERNCRTDAAIECIEEQGAAKKPKQDGADSPATTWRRRRWCHRL